MKKIILALVTAGFLLAGTIDLSVSSCTDNGDGTVTFAIDMQGDSHLYGFQFTINPGVELTGQEGASGGLAGDTGWMVSMGNNGVVMGFSMSNTPIPAQSEATTLSNLNFTGTCGGDLSLVDAELGSTISVWDWTGQFTGHIFETMVCTDPMYTDINDCTGAGHSWESESLMYTWTGMTSESVENGNGIISSFKLNENFPNPFNPSTTIAYDVAVAGEVSLTVFNMKGQEINTLVNGYHSVDSYSVQWDGTNNNGVEMPAGMYIYKLVADGFVQSNKMSFVK